MFGRVQGVYFRANTKSFAKGLGIRGWVRNSPQGTVQGHLEAEGAEVLETMKKWLEETGSPKSKIEKAVFMNETEREKFQFEDFVIRR